MKLKKRLKMTKEEPEVMVVDETGEAAENLNKAMSEVADVLVERDAEISALKLCLITQQHLMLEGPPGIAKSLLADEVFSHICGDDVVFFKKQLMANTQTDEIFGPLDSTKYREDAEYEIRTEGYLPSASFAFLDEVYRAANMILPAILGILNERTFQNGITHIACPLRTAIGTSNFTSDNPELEAFHDRWLVRINSLPLGNSESRIKALSRYLSWDATKKPRKSKVSVDDLDILRAAMTSVVIPAECLELYEEMVSHLRKAIPNVYISDRRFVQAFKLVLAAHVSAEKEEGCSTDLDAAMLHHARFGLIVINKPDQTDAFEKVYATVVGSYAENIQLSRKIDKVSQYVRKLEEEYDEGIDPEDCAELYIQIKRTQSAISGIQLNNSSGKNDRLTERIGKTTIRLSGLESTVVSKVDMALVQKIVSQKHAAKKDTED